jgi:hypothetical protein
MRAGPAFIAAAVGAVIAVTGLSACGGGDDDDDSPVTATAIETGPAALPPESTEIHSEDPEEEAGPAGEASPEVPATGPETGELEAIEEEAVAETVRRYIDALNRHQARVVCELFEPGALRLSELPVRRGGCTRSLAGSIGHRPTGGTPAWKRTKIGEIRAVSVEGVGARVTAAVVHRFADRNYTSVEDDVIYLRPAGDHWLLAKSSATLYRAVGYPEPPLSAFTPP